MRLCRKWVAGSPLPRRVRKPFELKPPTAEEKQRRKELREFKDLSTSRREQEAAKREVDSLHKHLHLHTYSSSMTFRSVYDMGHRLAFVASDS